MPCDSSTFGVHGDLLYLLPAALRDISFPLGMLGPLLFQSLEKYWKKGTCSTDWNIVCYFSGPHLEALVLWILNLVVCFLENIIVITILMYL